MIFSSYIFYLIPPAAGALIGYITNKIAITMLFRPYEQKRFLGIKVPFTPGIIPKQRHELARSIARQVSSELLSVEAVSAQMRTPGFQQGLESAIRRGGDIITPLPIVSILREPARSPLGKFSSLWKELAASPGLHRLGNALMQGFLRNSLSPDTGQTPGEENFGPAGTLIAGILRRHIREKRSLDDLLSPEAIQSLTGAFAGLFPTLRRLLIQWLNRKGTRKELHRRGILLLRDAVDSLSGFQRLVVVAGQYHRSMEENMSYLIDRFIQNLEESLESPETIQGLIAAAREYLERNLDKPISEFLEPGKIDELAKVVDTLVGGVDLFGSETAGTAAGFLSHIPDDLRIGDLVLWDQGGSDLLVPLLRNLVQDLLVKALPVALEVMDIEKLVILRIDSLAISEVESLLLEVVKKQLKWINIFGAFLGAILGGFQVLLMVFRG